MRNPALRALLVAVVAFALVASAGGAADAATTIPSLSDADDAPVSVPGTAEAAGEIAAGDASADASASADRNGPPIGPESIGRLSTTVRQQTEGDITSPSTTRIRIDLNDDRSADWTVAVRYSLADANETAAFNAAGDQFREGDVGPDAELFEGFRREANRNVDRSMAIQDVGREVVVHDDPSEFDVATEDAVAVGELRLTFTWTSFLARDGESLVLGDALTTPGNGTWLRSLESSQTLEVATPDGYTVTGTPSTAATQLSDGDVIIEGPQTFDGGESVVIVYGPAGAGIPWGMLTAAMLAAAALIAGSVVGYRRISADGDDADRSVANGSGDAQVGGQHAAGGGGAATADREFAGDESDATDEADDGDADEPDLSLLSDEERVERLLEDGGGRMRQADIVAETGWSDAKVSQLLSAMADDGRVEKLRLGRENLISLPDEDEGDDDG